MRKALPQDGLFDFLVSVVVIRRRVRPCWDENIGEMFNTVKTILTKLQ